VRHTGTWVRPLLLAATQSRAQRPWSGGRGPDRTGDGLVGAEPARIGEREQRLSAHHHRDVPDDALATLKARAAKAGKSLQAYALDLLVGEAARPTLAEAATRAEAEAGASLSTSDVLAAIDDARAGR
jgi:antitoxin FitA